MTFLFGAAFFRVLAAILFTGLDAALALAFDFPAALAGFLGFAFKGVRLTGRRACFLACLRAAFFTFFFDPFWAMTTFSSNKSPGIWFDLRHATGG
jgi:hypothetical protein